MKKFTKQFLKEVLQFNEKQIKITMEAQRKFPELLTEVNNEDFVIDGESLCSQLGVGSNFNVWLLGNNKTKEGKLIKYRCFENVDYINDYDLENVNFTKEEVKNMNSQQRSRNGIKNVIKLTLDCAKKIAMRQNNENGDLVCDYFILMEKAVKGMQEHLLIREPEAKGYNDMKVYVNKWCELNGFDNSDDSLTKREANMLNIALMNRTALELRDYIGYKDIQTREHLTLEKNKALSELQLVNSSLLMANLDFSARKQIIEDTCDAKYPHLKITN